MDSVMYEYYAGIKEGKGQMAPAEGNDLIYEGIDYCIMYGYGWYFLDFWEEGNSDISLRLDNGNTFIGGIDFEISDDKFSDEIILIVDKAIEKIMINFITL